MLKFHAKLFSMHKISGINKMKRITNYEVLKEKRTRNLIKYILLNKINQVQFSDFTSEDELKYKRRN